MPLLAEEGADRAVVGLARLVGQPAVARRLRWLLRPGIVVMLVPATMGMVIGMRLAVTMSRAALFAGNMPMIVPLPWQQVQTAPGDGQQPVREQADKGGKLAGHGRWLGLPWLGLPAAARQTETEIRSPNFTNPAPTVQLVNAKALRLGGLRGCKQPRKLPIWCSTSTLGDRLKNP